MPQANETDPTRRTGRHMMLIAWIGGIALLTFLFRDVLESRFNPNAQPQAETTADGRHQVVLDRNAAGHYVASGRINGFPVTFLLDTGATDVALPEALADRLRLERTGGGISQTANGAVAVWRTVLDEVRLGDIRLKDVRASILPSMAAGDPVLLGMSFLRRLEFSQRDGQLTLRH
ncbi:MAG: TIGR02281 family clan AA aspartic protease [Chromatiaceae bacterium]|nr:TIGR02281 family clan AA aspartic protease [Gammaproteobacteria bacterium]MCP5422900.1 TIGR02281 family clan AA aspartic protease [Chromatiaceae bacterium]